VNHVSSTAWQKRARCQKHDAAGKVSAQTCSQYMLHCITAPPQLPAAIQLHTLAWAQCAAYSAALVRSHTLPPRHLTPLPLQQPSRLGGSPAGYLGLGHTWQPPPSAATGCLACLHCMALLCILRAVGSGWRKDRHNRCVNSATQHHDTHGTQLCPQCGADYNKTHAAAISAVG
jgi:hypothetical protein